MIMYQNENVCEDLAEGQEGIHHDISVEGLYLMLDYNPSETGEIICYDSISNGIMGEWEELY